MSPKFGDMPPFRRVMTKRYGTFIHVKKYKKNTLNSMDISDITNNI